MSKINLNNPDGRASAVALLRGASKRGARETQEQIMQRLEGTADLRSDVLQEANRGRTRRGMREIGENLVFANDWKQYGARSYNRNVGAWYLEVFPAEGGWTYTAALHGELRMRGEWFATERGAKTAATRYALSARANKHAGG